MYRFHCPVDDIEVPPEPRRLLSAHRTSEGTVSYVRCRCGKIAVMVTGALLDRAVFHPAVKRSTPHPTTMAECA